MSIRREIRIRRDESEEEGTQNAIKFETVKTNRFRFSLKIQGDNS